MSGNARLPAKRVKSRETREGWPLLTVKTELNGDSKRTNDRGLPWLVPWTCCRAGTIDPALAALVTSQPSTKNYFPSLY
jgi:hypothetical protein